jgi:outer membrane biosynthesis protein TonB
MLRRHSSRTSWALLISVALHLGLFVLWARPVPAPKVTPPPRVADIEIHEIIRQAPKSQHKTTPVTPLPPAPRTESVPRSTTAEATHATSDKRPPAASSKANVSASAKSDSSLPTKKKAPSVAMVERPADEQKPDRSLERGGIAVPDLSNAGSTAAGRVAEFESSTELHKEIEPLKRGVQAPDQDPDVNRRVAGLIDAERGRRRVERGQIDPYFAEMGKTLLSQWDMSAEDKRKAEEPLLKILKENLVEGIAGYGEMLEEYGRTGKTSIGERVGPEGSDDMVERGLISEQMANSFTHHNMLLVRLTQGLDGKLLRVDLVQASNNPTMDAEVMRRLRSGETILPVPPAEGLGIHDPIRSVWAFELSVHVCPPAPVLSGTFDVSAIFDPKMGKVVNICVPLDKFVSKHVQLISVD